MMQRWGADAIRFMTDASEYGEYYSQLTAELLPYLHRDGHVCDAGCGLGYLAQEMSKYCAQVTAIDRSEAATQALLNRRLPQNMRVLCEDIFTIHEQFDAMVFCYFGRTDEILSLAKKLCKGNVLIVKRDCAEHKFSIGKVEHRRHTVEDTIQALEDLNVPYVQKQISLEMGQPFRNIDDAMTFFRLYNKSDREVELQEVENRLTRTDDPKFPLYLPSQRKMELIVFSASDLEV